MPDGALYFLYIIGLIFIIEIVLKIMEIMKSESGTYQDYTLYNDDLDHPHDDEGNII